MGRGVRGAEDYCVVLLLGARLTQLIANARNRELLSPATRAQVALSASVAEELAGHDLHSLIGVIRQVLGRDTNWIATSRSSLAGVAYPQGGVDEAVAGPRAAQNAAAAGQFETAVERMKSGGHADGGRRLKGWRRGGAGRLPAAATPRRRSERSRAPSS